MEYLVGVVLILTFFGLAWYCVKGLNLMVGFLIMAVLWTALPLLGTLVSSSAFIADNPVLQFGGAHESTLVSILNNIYQTAPQNWGTTLVNVLWGAWFGRVMMETGIASTIIRKTVELGGDRPMVTITLLNVVVAGIFTAMVGAGPVIAIGVIVLPILMSLGVPKPLALFTFVGSVASGIYVNPVIFGQIRAFLLTGDQMPDFNLSWVAGQFGFAAMGISVAITTIMAGIYLGRSKKSHAWAAQSGSTDQKNAPFYTLILPIVPVILHIWTGFSVIGGFVLSGFAALFLCGKMKGSFRANCQLVNKLYFDGIVDTAPLIGFLLVLPMFNTAATYASPYFGVILGPIMPSSELVVILLFAALIGFGLFRGPMTLFGCGAATLGVLANVGEFSIPFLFLAFAIPTITTNIGACITQSWNAWGLAYTKVESRDFLKLSIPWAYVSGILLYILGLFTMTNMGAQWFV